MSGQVLDAQTIYDAIVAHMRSQGGNVRGWYAGIASDVNQRLFGDHRVPTQDHWWIHRRAVSADAARAVEKALLELGCDGGPGGGDHTTLHVYAYLKSATTRQ